MRPRWLMAFLVAALPLAAMAQRTDFVSRTELVLAGGGLSYIGDLNDQSAFGDLHGGGSIGLRSRIDSRWSVRGMVSYGSLSAEKDCNEHRNLSFRSDLFEGAMTLEFDFRPYGPVLRNPCGHLTFSEGWRSFISIRKPPMFCRTVRCNGLNCSRYARKVREHPAMSKEDPMH